MRTVSQKSKYKWTDIYFVSIEEREAHFSKFVVLLGKTNLNRSHVNKLSLKKSISIYWSRRWDSNKAVCF